MLAVLNSFLKEPLLHFLVLGTVLFALNQARPKDDDPRRIALSDSLYQDLATTYASSHGRKPTEAELRPAVDAWLTNEVLYREGRALQLDQGDDMIRERVIQKMRVMVHGGVVVPEAAEDVLREWFEARREAYDQPERLSFVQVEFAERTVAEEKLAEVQAAEKAGTALEAGHLRIIGFRERPRNNVESLFGGKFVDRLAELPVGEWHVVESQRGWHLARLDGRVPRRPADFRRVLNRVRKDRYQDEINRRGWEAIEGVMDKYDIVRDDLGEFLRELETPPAPSSEEGEDV